MAGRRRKVTASPPPQPIGADGYPITSDYGDEAFLRTLEFEEREAERAERTRAQSDEALLRTLERAVMKDHYFPALMDALELCRKENHPLPRWLHDRIWEILDHVYNAKAKNWKRHEAETKRREKHWRRYDLVEELLDRRGEQYMGHDLPRTRKAVVDAVAEKLNESPHTVMGSYWKIKRDGAPYVARYRARAASVKKPRKKR